MLVSETSRQEATCLRMNWDTWGSEQLLSWARAGGLDVSPGSRREGDQGGFTRGPHLTGLGKRYRAGSLSTDLGAPRARRAA